MQIDPALLARLETFTEERRAKMLHVVAHRIEHISLVLEDIQDPHNIAACLRSAEAFGIQQVHLIHPSKKWKTSHAVAKGVSKWIDLETWDSGQAVFEKLKADGFQIAASFPPDKDRALPFPVVHLEELPTTQKIALVFGNEHWGIHDPATLEQVDCGFYIPMFGFVESLNISVAAAVSMYTMRTKVGPASISFQERTLKKWIEDARLSR